MIIKTHVIVPIIEYGNTHLKKNNISQLKMLINAAQAVFLGLLNEFSIDFIESISYTDLRLIGGCLNGLLIGREFFAGAWYLSLVKHPSNADNIYKNFGDDERGIWFSSFRLIEEVRLGLIEAINPKI